MIRRRAWLVVAALALNTAAVGLWACGARTGVGLFDDVGNDASVPDARLPDVGVDTTIAVGTPTLGAGRWGQLDLAGDVWEWTLDVAEVYANPCADCAYLAAGSDARMIRGSDWFNVPTAYLQPPYRDTLDLNPPARRAPGVGFRCARPPYRAP